LLRGHLRVERGPRPLPEARGAVLEAFSGVSPKSSAASSTASDPIPDSFRAASRILRIGAEDFCSNCLTSASLKILLPSSSTTHHATTLRPYSPILSKFLLVWWSSTIADSYLARCPAVMGRTLT